MVVLCLCRRQADALELVLDNGEQVRDLVRVAQGDGDGVGHQAAHVQILPSSVVSNQPCHLNPEIDLPS